MMKAMCSMFPLLFIRWFAVRHCERFVLNGRTYARPFKDVLVEVRGPKS